MNAIFLSHAGPDLEKARVLRRELEALGHPCWLAADDIAGSGVWAAELVRALSDSRALVVLISPASLSSAHVLREVTMASDLGKPIIPVRLEDVPLSGSLEYMLSVHQWQDAFPEQIGRYAPALARRLSSIDSGSTDSESSAPVTATGNGVASIPGWPPPAMVRPPAPSTSLIGREADVTAIHALLAAQDTRLVSLLGPGGIGKSRLGAEVATMIQEDDDRPAAWVALGGLSKPDHIPGHIAQSLGLADSDGTVRRIAAWIGEQPCLLVLDNLEHLLPAAADTVADLLSAAPPVKVLITSRVATRLTGEHRYTIRALACPSEGSTAPRGFPAYDLFLSRAREVNPQLEDDPRSTSAIAELCRKLAGVPLAIELAAARANVLSPPALLARLDNSFHTIDLLGRPSDGRQRSLEAMIDSSFAMLTTAALEVLAQLSVFRAGFTVDAAEAVVGLDASSDVASSTLQCIAELVDASMLEVTQQGSGDHRFSILEPIREIAFGRLSAEPERAAATRDAHARYFCSWLNHLWPSVPRDPRTPADEQRMTAEQENIREAIEWADQRHQQSTFADLVVCAAPFFRNIDLGAEWTERLERIASSEAIGPRRIDALLQLVDRRAEASQRHAMKPARRALELAEADGDVVRQAWALGWLAYDACMQGDGAVSNRLTDKAMHLLDTVASPDPDESCSLLNLLGCGRADDGSGDPMRAARLQFRKSQDLSRAAGDAYTYAKATVNLSEIALTLDHPNEALRFASQAVKALKPFNAPSANNTAAGLLGNAHVFTGQPREGLEQLLGAADVARRLGRVRYFASLVLSASAAFAELNHHERATQLLAIHDVLFERYGLVDVDSEVTMRRRFLSAYEKRAQGLVGQFDEITLEEVARIMSAPTAVEHPSE